MNSIPLLCICLLIPVNHLLAHPGNRPESRMDTIPIDEVSVSYRQPGFGNMELDTAVLNQENGSVLGEVLSKYTPVFIKDYGSGQISTPSFRGTGASHTKVSWNGINITNPMLGQCDFSTYPAYLTDKITVHQGSGSLEAFSNAIGGSINLYNEPDWNNAMDLKAIQHIGSYNTTNSFITAAMGNNTLRNRTRMYYKHSENDFEYLNADFSRNAKYEKRKYANYDFGGIMNEMYWRVTDQGFLSAKVWGQFYNRNIPGPVSASKQFPNENQENKNLRSVMEWKQYKDQESYEIKSSYLYDFIQYNHKNLNIHSISHIHSLLNKFQGKKQLKQGWSVKYGSSVDHYQVKTNNYEGLKDRTRLSVHQVVTKEIDDRFMISGLLKEELVNREFSPLIFRLATEAYLLEDKMVTLKGNVSKNHHYPSFNDLYWKPGGNPDLKPESGYSYETGAAFEHAIFNETGNISLELTGFYSDIDNWIMWKPVTASIWSPENARQVISKGLETSLRANWKFLDAGFMVNGNYAYTSSADISEDMEYQLSYVPKNQLNSSIHVQYKRFSLHYVFQYTGKRFTDYENLHALDAYSISDAAAGYRYTIANVAFSMQLKIKNLFDENYQVVEYQPLPGRNYQLSLSVDL